MNSSSLKLVVFDLDDTVWYPEMYMLSGSPFKKDNTRSDIIYDQSNTKIKIIKGAKDVIEELLNNYPTIQIGFASRTFYPEWAEECLKLFKIQGKTLEEIGIYQEIYPGDKQTHFKNFKKNSGFEYNEMVFFDNENRNCISVSKLGVKCYYTPNGMEYKYWEKCKNTFSL